MAKSAHRCVTTRFAVLAALGIFFALPAPRADASAYEAGEPAPSGTLRIARPTLVWRIAPRDGTRITKLNLVLNGESLPVGYSEERQAVVYTPPAPLPPGDYAAHCTLVLDGWWTVERTWHFRIAPDAAEPPAPDAQQQSALALVNAYRRLLALPPLRLDARLCAAAAGHSAYLHRNGTLAHEQQPGRPGFTGVRPAERRAAFGYADGCFENLAAGSVSLAAAVRGLFDAPYHRIAFLQPGSPDFGAGQVGDRTTLKVGQTETEGVVVYPAEGQQDVPTAWSGEELPDPLRLHGASGPVGYVITLFYFSPKNPRLYVDDATLTTDDGRPVAFYLNTPDNDSHLSSGVFLIPKKPLLPGTAYRVSVTARTEGGRGVSRAWRFTTASASRQLAERSR